MIYSSIGSCFKKGASCTSKCHGGRGNSKAACCNTPELAADLLQLPGAFASRPRDAGAMDPAARKQHLLEEINRLQGGMLLHVWVVGSDVLNGDVDAWALGKLTHEAGHTKPFLVVYNDGTSERYTDVPLSEAEDGALRHEVEMGYICPTRPPTAEEWGNAAFGPAPAAAAGSQTAPKPRKRKGAAESVKAAKVAKPAKPPKVTKPKPPAKAAPATATSGRV